jgi:predicted RNA binding protein YcfA (HicA-like mRNA interferase family)
MLKIPVIKAKALLRVLEKLGFFEWHRVGSHAQWKHADGRRITVPVHAGHDIQKNMLEGIINDLGITVEEFIAVMKS